MGKLIQRPDETVHEIEYTAAPQKRIPTVWVVLMCIAAAAFVFLAVYVGRILVVKGTESLVKEKDFTLAGLTVTLTNEFEIFTGSENVAVSGDIALTVLTEPFSTSDGLEDMSPDDYLTLIRDLNNCTDSEIRTASNGVRYFTFTSEDGTSLFFVSTLKGDTCFYCCQFSLPAATYSEETPALIASFAATAREE